MDLLARPPFPIHPTTKKATLWETQSGQWCSIKDVTGSGDLAEVVWSKLGQVAKEGKRRALRDLRWQIVVRQALGLISARRAHHSDRTEGQISNKKQRQAIGC